MRQGLTGRCGFTNAGNNSVGRVTKSGVVTNYTSAALSIPHGITAGSDGAMWVTNGTGNSIARVTTSGVLTNYAYPGVAGVGIAAGRDGALWFTTAGNAAVRITTSVAPSIAGFAPSSGTVGTTVTITGRNLAGASTVAFNGTPASIVSDTATQIVTAVPAGATTGRVTVTTPAGTATNTRLFTAT